MEVGRARNIDLATLLAFTMAHEMGHRLLPAPSHAIAGIMRADWGGQEFRDIADHSLRFTPAQGQAIHGKASASRSVN